MLIKFESHSAPPLQSPQTHFQEKVGELAQNLHAHFPPPPHINNSFCIESFCCYLSANNLGYFFYLKQQCNFSTIFRAKCCSWSSDVDLDPDLHYRSPPGSELGSGSRSKKSPEICHKRAENLTQNVKYLT